MANIICLTGKFLPKYATRFVQQELMKLNQLNKQKAIFLAASGNKTEKLMTREAAVFSRRRHFATSFKLGFSLAVLRREGSLADKVCH